MNYSALVEVKLQPGIADPQGATVESAMPALGFKGVSSVRIGKAIRFAIDSPDEASARTQIEDMCNRFLINPVIESASVTLEEVT